MPPVKAMASTRPSSDGIRPDVLAQPVDHDVEGERGVGVAGGPAVLDLAQVGDAGEALSPLALLSAVSYAAASSPATRSR